MTQHGPRSAAEARRWVIREQAIARELLKKGLVNPKAIAVPKVVAVARVRCEECRRFFAPRVPGQSVCSLQCYLPRCRVGYGVKRAYHRRRAST